MFIFLVVFVMLLYPNPFNPLTAMDIFYGLKKLCLRFELNT